MASGLFPSSLTYHKPTGSNEIIGASPPPINTADNPWGSFIPSIRAKYPERQSMVLSSATLDALPFSNGWEKTFCPGMPVFVCKKRGVAACGMSLVATLPIINYYQEEAARLERENETTYNELKRHKTVEDFNAKAHLYFGDAEDFLRSYDFFGTIDAIEKKTGDYGSTMQGAHMTCIVSGTADIVNHWGAVGEGDKIGWKISALTPDKTYFTDPNGNNRGSYSRSAPKCMQIVPISMGKTLDCPVRNSNQHNPKEPRKSDLDYLSTVRIPQMDLKMDLKLGVLEPIPIDSNSGRYTKGILTYEAYTPGLYVHVGTVRKVNKFTTPSQATIEAANRDHHAAKDLPTISVYLRA